MNELNTKNVNIFTVNEANSYVDEENSNNQNQNGKIVSTGNIVNDWYDIANEDWNNSWPCIDDTVTNDIATPLPIDEYVAISDVNTLLLDTTLNESKSKNVNIVGNYMKEITDKIDVFHSKQQIIPNAIDLPANFVPTINYYKNEVVNLISPFNLLMTYFKNMDFTLDEYTVMRFLPYCTSAFVINVNETRVPLASAYIIDSRLEKDAFGNYIIISRDPIMYEVLNYLYNHNAKFRLINGVYTLYHSDLVKLKTMIPFGIITETLTVLARAMFASDSIYIKDVPKTTNQFEISKHYDHENSMLDSQYAISYGTEFAFGVDARVKPGHELKMILSDGFSMCVYAHYVGILRVSVSFGIDNGIKQSPFGLIPNQFGYVGPISIPNLAYGYNSDYQIHKLIVPKILLTTKGKFVKFEDGWKLQVINYKSLTNNEKNNEVNMVLRNMCNQRYYFNANIPEIEVNVCITEDEGMNIYGRITPAKLGCFIDKHVIEIILGLKGQKPLPLRYQITRILDGNNNHGILLIADASLLVLDKVGTALIIDGQFDRDLINSLSASRIHIIQLKDVLEKLPFEEFKNMCSQNISSISMSNFLTLITSVDLNQFFLRYYSSLTFSRRMLLGSFARIFNRYRKEIEIYKSNISNNASSRERLSRYGFIVFSSTRKKEDEGDCEIHDVFASDSLKQIWITKFINTNSKYTNASFSRSVWEWCNKVGSIKIEMSEIAQFPTISECIPGKTTNIRISRTYIKSDTSMSCINAIKSLVND